MLAVVALVGVAGCDGEKAEAEPAKATAPTPQVPTVAAAKAAFDEYFNSFTIRGCPEDCTADLQKIISLTHDLRKAMNADKAGATFWSGAYVHMNAIDRGATTAGQALDQFRPLILGPAHDLQRWMTAHPAQ
ncbi:hypothetical protein ACIOUE_07085 [Streptomyces xanthochromogenes]|uniref:hypothetical protein n=1 Tax=Streptomyces xanthochromogenes TaxID=67384 RepID=UPI0034150E64